MAYPYYNYNPYQGYYQPMYQQTQQPVMQQPMMQQQAQQAAPQSYSPAINQSGGQVQNGGFVTVRSEAEARAYPVAPGMSVTFKNESAPYCYTKTMGFSQLEAPKFEKFRLVKEETEDSSNDGDNENTKMEYAPKSDIGILASAIKEVQKNYETLRSDLESTRSDLDYVMTKRQPSKSKKDVENDN
jgi:hypothetical protein